jgi:beta-lactamase regulating signal transducer with metallopeptidase domain
VRPGRAAAAIALATLAIRSAAGRDIVEVMAYVLLLFIPLSLALRLISESFQHRSVRTHGVSFLSDGMKLPGPPSKRGAESA